jgi:hypothetical protein
MRRHSPKIESKSDPLLTVSRNFHFIRELLVAQDCSFDPGTALSICDKVSSPKACAHHHL